MVITSQEKNWKVNAADQDALSPPSAEVISEMWENWEDWQWRSSASLQIWLLKWWRSPRVPQNK